MEKVQIEEVVEEAIRKILAGGIYDDFLQQCLNLVYYLEVFDSNVEHPQNAEESVELTAISYLEENCEFFSKYQYKELEEIYKGIVNKLPDCATSKELTHLQAFRLAVAEDFLFSFITECQPLPEENPKIRFAKHYLDLIDQYKTVNVQNGCFMFSELDAK